MLGSGSVITLECLFLEVRHHPRGPATALPLHRIGSKAATALLAILAVGSGGLATWQLHEGLVRPHAVEAQRIGQRIAAAITPETRQVAFILAPREKSLAPFKRMVFGMTSSSRSFVPPGLVNLLAGRFSQGAALLSVAIHRPGEAIPAGAGPVINAGQVLFGERPGE